MILARGGGELAEGDMVVMFSGSGSEERMTRQVFKQQQKVVKQVFLMKSLESLTARMCRLRGLASQQQLESMAVVTRSNPTHPTMSFLHHSASSTAGNVLGPISLGDPWRLPIAEKKAVLGSRASVPCGGAVAGIDPDVPEDEGQDADRPPVFYHAVPYTVFEDLIVAYNMKAIIDLTPGDGALAYACVRTGKSYVGLRLTPEHEEKLRTHLLEQTLAASATHGDDLYDANFVSALKRKTEEQAVGAAAKKPKSGKAKAKKGTGKAKAKAKKASAEKKDDGVCVVAGSEEETSGADAEEWEDDAPFSDDAE